MAKRRSRRRKADRLGSLVPLVLLLLALAGFSGYLAADQHGQYVRSQRTQHDGVRAIATITSTRTVKHTTKGGTNYESLWKVRLARAVDGRRTTTVHLRGRSRPPAGERREIVLDPRAPEYAEVVGKATRTNFDWAGSAVVSAVLVLIAVVVVFRFVFRSVRRRRSGDRNRDIERRSDTR